jgi:hypothetical protein
MLSRFSFHLLLAVAVLGALAAPVRALVTLIPDATPKPATPRAIEKSKPAATPKPKPVEPPKPAPDVPAGEQTYRGNVGPYTAVFTFKIAANGQVTGSYILTVDRGLVLQLTGTNTPGKLQLAEYTRGALTANIQLELKKTPTEIRWEGTMYNTPPDNRVFPVVISRPR